LKNCVWIMKIFCASVVYVSGSGKTPYGRSRSIGDALRPMRLRSGSKGFIEDMDNMDRVDRMD